MMPGGPSLTADDLPIQFRPPTIRTFKDLKEWAEENIPEDFAALPDPRSYTVAKFSGRVRLHIGKMPSNPIVHTCGCAEGTTMVWAYIRKSTGKLGITTNKDVIHPPGYGDIQFCEPFRSISGGLTETNGLEKFEGFVRYVLMAQGHPGYLEKMSFGIHEVFGQTCSEIVRAHESKTMKEVWAPGRRSKRDENDGVSDDRIDREEHQPSKRSRGQTLTSRPERDAEVFSSVIRRFVLLLTSHSLSIACSARNETSKSCKLLYEPSTSSRNKRRTRDATKWKICSRRIGILRLSSKRRSLMDTTGGLSTRL